MKAKKTKYTLRKDGRIVMTKVIDGKREYFYGKTDKNVEAQYLQRIHKPPKPKPQCRTFSQCADDWWEQKESELSPNTVRNYRALKTMVSDEFKNIPVNEITPVQIASYLRRVSAQGYSQKAINNRKSVIKAIMDDALLAGEISMNPCIHLPLIKGKRKQERLPASDEDIKRIIAHRNDSNVARMVYFILCTGCRRGEAAALQAKHINRQNRTAHICQTLAYSSPTPQIKPCPKTEAGVRDVVLLDEVCNVLQEYRNPNTFVFFPTGLPTEKQFQKMIDEYRKSIGITCTLHQLRHSYATILHSAGVDAKDAQYLLGHSSILVTQDIYTSIDNLCKSKLSVQISEAVQKSGLLSTVLSKSAKPHESST